MTAPQDDVTPDPQSIIAALRAERDAGLTREAAPRRSCLVMAPPRWRTANPRTEADGVIYRTSWPEIHMGSARARCLGCFRDAAVLPPPKGPISPSVPVASFPRPAAPELASQRRPA